MAPQRGVIRSKRFMVVIAVAFGVAMVSPAAAQEFRPTLQKIKETGAIDLGYRETSPPLSFFDSGRPAGYSVELCQQVALALKQSAKLAELKLNWVPVTPADRITKLVKGQVDLGCESSTITFARMEQVAFSHMIFVDGGSLLATAASGIDRVKDLSGKRVLRDGRVVELQTAWTGQ